MQQLAEIIAQVAKQFRDDLNQGPRTLWYLAWDAVFFPGEVLLRLLVLNVPAFASWLDQSDPQVPGIMAGLFAIAFWYLMFWLGMRISRLLRVVSGKGRY